MSEFSHPSSFTPEQDAALQAAHDELQEMTQSFNENESSRVSDAALQAVLDELVQVEKIDGQDELPGSVSDEDIQAALNDLTAVPYDDEDSLPGAYDSQFGTSEGEPAPRETLRAENREQGELPEVVEYGDSDMPKRGRFIP